MTRSDGAYATSRITRDDVKSDFSCGEQPLDTFFRRFALGNDADGIGLTYVLRREPEHPDGWPRVLGFYTLSMANVEPQRVATVMGKKLPGYPSPVALIGRLATDQRARGRGLGEGLLIDALSRVVAAADILGCVGVIVDAKNEGADAGDVLMGSFTIDDADRDGCARARRWPCAGRTSPWVPA